MRPAENHDINGNIIGLAESLDAVLATTHRRIGEAETSAIEHVAETIQSVLVSVHGQAESATNSKSVWTPPELAREWGVNPDKILAWIRSGELKAVNVAASQSGRPRYRIDAEAITMFKLKRTTQSPAPQVRRKRRLPDDIIEFF